MNSAVAVQALDRQTGVGASEIAAIVGLHPYQTAIDVYLAKIGEAEPDLANQHIRFGTLLEPFLLEEYRLRVGGRYLSAQEIADRYGDRAAPGLREGQVSVRHPEFPWLWSTPDGVLELPNGDLRGVEAKNRGARMAALWGESESDGVPDAEAIQCLIGMACLELPAWGIAPYFGGSDFRNILLTPDPEICGVLIGQAGQFWFDHVVPRVPPPPVSGNKATQQALARLFRTHRGDDLLIAGDETTPVLEDYFRVRAQREEIEAEEDLLEARLKAVIGDAPGLELRDGRRVTWKKAKDSEVIDWQNVAQDLCFRFSRLTGQQFDPEIKKLYGEAAVANTTTKPGSRRFCSYHQPPKGRHTR